MSQHPYGQQPSDPYRQQPAPYGGGYGQGGQGYGQQPGRLNTQASYPSAGAHRYDPKAGPEQLIPNSQRGQQQTSPYGQPQQPPVAPYAQQPTPYGQPQQASPYGQPQQSAGADQGSLYQPGDEQRYPYGLPPEVVAQRRGQQSDVARSQPSAGFAPQSQPSASYAPLPQPSASYAPQSQPSAVPQSQPSAPAPHEATPNPYSSYAPAPTSDPSPYSSSAERGPYAPYSGQELGATHEPGEPYRQQGTGSYTGQSDDTNSGSRQREHSVFAPPSYPTYSSQPSASQHETGETNLQLRGDERPADEGWIVEFDDGQQVEIHSLALIGRNPQARPGEEAELITLGDETRKVSKTHLAIGVDQRGIYLCDRGSTNGTAIENAPDDFRPCPEGEIVRLQEGQKISFGDHALYIRRQA